MNQSVLFVMSISGTTVFLAYWLFYPLMKHFSSVKWRYRILKLSLFFYLFPLPLYKYDILNIPLIADCSFIHDSFGYNGDTTYTDFSSRTLIQCGEDYYISRDLQFLLIAAVIIGIISITLIYIQLYRYFKLKKYYHQNSIDITDTDTAIAVQTCTASRRLKILQKIQLKRTTLNISPCTIGVFHPIIYVPEFVQTLDDQRIEYILKHELTHIKHQDLVFRFLALGVMAVHWFNPCCFLLFREICNISEIYCDESVIKGNGDTYRADYSRLMIDISSLKLKTKFFFRESVSLISNAKVLKRRILEMKSTNKKNQLLPTIIFSTILFAGITTVLAYEKPPSTVDSDFVSKSGIKISDGIFHIHPIPESEGNWSTFSTDEDTSMTNGMIDSVPFDHYFTDSEGNITEYRNDTPQPNNICKHSYISGTYTDHIRNKNGNCTVSTYSAKKCTNCNKLILISLKSENSYKPCPH